MATYSSVLAWKIPWTEEPGRLQSMGLQSWTQLKTCTHMHFSYYSHNIASTTYKKITKWTTFLFQEIKNESLGTILAFQWLRLHASTAGGISSIPAWEINIQHAKKRLKKTYRHQLSPLKQSQADIISSTITDARISQEYIKGLTSQFTAEVRHSSCRSCGHKSMGQIGSVSVY